MTQGATPGTLEKWSVALEERVSRELAADPIRFEGDGRRPVWSIDTPPPYPSGKWHIGAVAGYSLIDVIARSKRMEGHDVLFPWGVDRNGINIELALERKAGKRMQDFPGGREAFIAACAREIQQYSDDMVRIAQRVGLSAEFSGPNSYATDSPDYRAFSQACFLDLFEEGLIVEDLRPNAYDAKLGTAIADADIHYDERTTKLNHVTWDARDGAGNPVEIVVSTTRPELICACRAVLVHPDNDATRHLVGKTAVLPLPRGPGLPPDVPILAHPHVKTDFGSGIMMVCSYGDQADVNLFRELRLEPIAAIGLDGRMTEAAGPYAGLKVEEARRKVVEDLQAQGRLAGQEDTVQKFPTSERSGAAVELILLKEWYVRQTHCQDELRRIAGEIEFHPPKHRQLLLDWIDTVTIDWPISRRRWYHTEIPLWHLVDSAGRESAYVVVPPKGPYHQPWRTEPPAGSRVLDRATRQDLGPLDAFLRAHPGLKPSGEQKVFDTWMDSSVSNLHILRPYRGRAWAKDHVTSVRPQGRDIVRTWLYYTVLKSYLLHEATGAVPRKAFGHAWVTGLGMDKQGRKMSKSLGNVIDPDEVVKKVGSDAFRLWIAGESTVGDDFRINEEKIAGAGKFLQKLANVAAFVGKFPQPAKPPARLHPADEWILGELDAVAAEARQAYAALDFFTPANGVRSFVWNTFAPHYLEMVKGRAYAGDEAACWTLHEALRTVLLLLAPITPFAAHYYANGLYGIDVHRSRFPEPRGRARDPGTTERIVAFNGAVWKAKQEQGLSLGAPISGVAVPPELQGFEPELRDMHKLA